LSWKSRSLSGKVGIAIVAVSFTIAVVVSSCGSSGPASTPIGTINTFLQASASGDAAKACAQLSPQAQGEVVQGVSCRQGIKDGALVYGSIIKQITVTGLSVHGTTATATSMLNGHPTATLMLRKQGGKWIIVQERRVSSSPAATATSNSSGPTQAQVAAVAGCLDQTFETVDNGGLDDTGNVPHVVLSVDAGGSSAAEVDVFASALAALSGYRPIKNYEGSLTTKLASTSVIVYLKSLTAGQQRAIEACG
jgi:hypothetical protein